MAKGALVHSLKIPKWWPGVQNWSMGSGQRSNPGRSHQFLLNKLSKPQLNLNLTQPQPNITLVGLDMKYLTTTPHTNTTRHKNSMAVIHISCYWQDFDETLKVASSEHLEQIPTVRVTSVHATFVVATYVHTRNISAVTDPIFKKP